MPDTILLTGAAGFIGSHTAERLLAEGYRVIGLDNFDPYYDPVIKKNNIGNALANDNYRFIDCDICEAADLELVFRQHKPKLVIHLAARAGVRPSWEDPVLYELVNVVGTIHLLMMSGKHGVEHFIYGSSSSVYGINRQVPFAPEHTTQLTISPYAASKLAAEGHVHAYHHLHGFRATTLRFFTVYGPRQRPEMAIHKFVRLIDEGKKIPMFGDGESARDYTYIDDIIGGVVSCINRHGELYEILNLGSTHVVKLKELITVVGDAMGVSPKIELHPEAPGDVPITYADIKKTGSLLGYAPTTTIERGIPKFVEWYRRKKKEGIL